jgi:transcriptional regulator
MVAGPNKYPPLDSRHVAQLIEKHPLAWIVSSGAGDFTVTPLPLRAQAAADGSITRLVGHFARSNPHVEVLKREPRALILFRGEQSYISPSWVSDRTWAPTWNHIGAQFVVDIEFLQDPAALREVLRDLIDAMEAGRPNQWHLEEVGARYDKLAPHIVAFHAHVRESKAVFKLGQDERTPIYDDIIKGVSQTGAPDLATWMQLYNTHRTDK